MAHANDDDNGVVTPRHIEHPLLLPLTHNRGRLPTTTMAHIDNTNHDTNNAGTPRHKPEQTDEPQMAQRHVAVTTWHVNAAVAHHATTIATSPPPPQDGQREWQRRGWCNDTTTQQRMTDRYA
ncbi:hypothetical protein K443DRAFT_13833 [Laccaria amethystina LaAM-08-1]|uniref:Uncharacterized protein n=1 Tax=Laccaria amethystina LaAM-08-1 TaxID=1095629 RepID=A0A0C9WUF2_9AGAR|nr:hypothetical protein K443DRAFT_13833 [Laccaria amethystina LaAM-08-1]